MKRIVTAAAALSLIATAALADDTERDHGDRGGGDRGGRAQAQQRSEPQAAAAAPTPAPAPAREPRPARDEPRGPRPEATPRPAQVQAQPQPQAQPQVVRTENDRRGLPPNGARGGVDRPPQVRTTESGPAPQTVRPERRQETRSEPRLPGPFGQAVAGAQAAARRDNPELDRDGRRDGQRDGDRNGWSRNDRDGRGGDQARNDPTRNRNGGDGRRDGDNDRDGDRNGWSRTDRNDRDGRGGDQARNDPTRNRNGGSDGRRGGDNDRDHDRNGWSRDGGRGGWDNNHRGPTERPPWARPDGRWDRDHDRGRYDPRRYPHIWKSNHRYRLSTYYVAPFGYYDHGWSFGEYLPWGWYGPSYWIDDWFSYGLPPPPIGCEWVRVGRDAILVDTFTGQVISVARLLFW